MNPRKRILWALAMTAVVALMAWFDPPTISSRWGGLATVVLFNLAIFFTKRRKWPDFLMFVGSMAGMQWYFAGFTGRSAVFEAIYVSVFAMFWPSIWKDPTATRAVK